MIKVSVYSKKAFTLAETIMTLVVISLVVTAAIPVFTIKKTDMSGHEVNTPWNYCNEDEKRGLCTTQNIALGQRNAPYTYSKQGESETGGVVAVPHNASLSVQTTNLNSNIFDIVRSNQRWFKVGEHNITEERSNENLLITPSLPATNTGNRNVLIGSAGDTLGNDNIIIGNNTGVTGSNNIVIGSNNTAAGNNSLVLGSGNTGIGSGAIVVGSNISAVDDGAIAIGDNADNAAANTLNIDGKIIADTSRITFTNDIEIHDTFLTNNPQNISSDKRYKNIKGSYNKGLKEILQIEPVNFYYKGNCKNNIHTGVVAQDIQEIFPEAVVKMPNGYYAVNNDPIFFAMLNSLKEINKTTVIEEKKQQEMQKELADLKEEIETLEGCNSDSFKCKIKYLFYDIKNFFKSIFNHEVKYDEKI